MRTLWIFLIGLALLSLSGCDRDEREASFAAEVKPVLDKYCLDCHAVGKTGYEASGLSMESYETIMEGTQFGPVIIPGDNVGSVLNMLVEGRADPSIKMPHGDRPGLSEDQVEMLALWVKQGAKNN